MSSRSFLARALRALVLGALLLCPACARGLMFRSPFAYALRRHCSRCGIVFERDPGEVAGGMAINMVLTSILGVAAAVYLAFFTDVPSNWAIFGMIGGMLAFGLLFHRHARGLWVGVLYITGAIHER